MKATYDVGLNYYQKKVPNAGHSAGKYVEGGIGKDEFELGDIQFLVNSLAGRKVTGGEAKEALLCWYENGNAEAQELIRLVIDRSIGASVGDTMVLKTWPDLYFLPPYQRCSLMDDKAKERFNKLPNFYVQTKCDGSFAYLVKRLNGTCDVITRQGGKYPKAFAESLTKDVPVGFVLVGELTVSEANEGLGLQMLDRKTGNGILTSCLKDGEGMASNQTPLFTAWDMVTEDEFVAGKSARMYKNRLQLLSLFIEEGKHAFIERVETHTVMCLNEAFTIYTDHTSRGLEGCVAKDPSSLWKDGTAKDIVKMKLKFEVEMRCIGMYEGEGKAKGMLGGIMLASEDGLMENNCGSGFSDEQRKDFWENPWKIDGHVCAIEANDITQDRDLRKKPSLSLPIFVEIRNDKTVADTYAEIVAQHEAAKQGK